ncbi:MAG TPA: alpha/beta hydrolase [Luteibacter sp.]|uniref:alpha/beta fold hydrolase n=1 Tax=Luteibacter sp. TaxID=1886636 RepID=UPI002CCF45AA|nr:alpha/beta hydrolase [Luteibacter sp.]HVI56073.1 alpha/beta hydrolase [Luteibacter sp.]
MPDTFTGGGPRIRDDDLTQLAAHGVPALPTPVVSGYVDNENARIWYASMGAGPPVVLLHGGLGNAGNWGHQVPVLTAAGYTAIVIDSRGQGRSSRDRRPYSYALMAADTRAVMDALGVARAAFIGWSDGADTALVLSRETPDRSAGVFFFACNVDSTGTRPFQPSPVIDRIYRHHVEEYAALSPVVGGFEAMRDDLGPMQAGQPNYGPDTLGEIAVPVWSVLGEHDEFIDRDHAQYIARTIPRARFVLLPAVSHFAPLQRPDVFNREMLAFLSEVVSGAQLKATHEERNDP